MMEYNLQFFAKEGPGGEKTEEPTGKKLKDARNEGQVAKSKELTNLVGLLSLFLILKFAMGYLGKNFLSLFSFLYERFDEMIIMPNGFVPKISFVSLLQTSMLAVLKMVAPFLIIGFVTAFIVDLIQVKWNVSTKPLKPKFNKLNPVNGVKRIFSSRSLVELLKSIVKIFLIGWVAYSTIKKNADFIYLMFNIPLWQGIAATGDLIVSFGLKVVAVYTVVTAFDFWFQRHKHHEDLKMTKQEVKDEMKNAEGDPQIKGKQKQRMLQASRRRMMQQLPEADVVITNPTHFAVAVKYDTDIAPAPIVIAKGEDYLAQKIKEKAKEYQIEIVENKPLARMLYHNVELGEQVPPELYQAVAEVIAMVYHLQGKI